MIPKIIHYCWFGGEKPPLVEKCILTWKDKLPGWQFCEWNEQNSPVDVPYVKNALASKRYAFAADYVRFHALYTLGGVYLDTDMEVIKDFTPLLDVDFFIGEESAGVINAAVIGAVKEFYIIKKIIDLLSAITSSRFEAIPVVLGRAISVDEFDKPGNVLLKYDFFYPYNPFDKKRNSVRQFMFCDVKPQTFAIHHWQQSWNYTLEERVIRRLKMILKIR